MGNQFEFVDNFVITGPVMTFPEVSTTGKYPVCAVDKSFKDKNGIYPAGAHDPDDPNMGWILKSGNACCVRRSITTPVAKKSEYFGFILVRCHLNNSVCCCLLELIAPSKGFYLRQYLIIRKAAHIYGSRRTNSGADTASFTGCRDNIRFFEFSDLF